MQKDRNAAKPSLFALAVGLAIVACGSSQDHAQTASDVAGAIQVAGLTLARWEVQSDGCAELDVCESATDHSPACDAAVAACVARARAQTAALWTAWDRAVAVYDAYVTSLEQGSPGPSWATVLAAYCEAVRATPDGAPSGLVVAGVCPQTGAR